MVLRPKEKKEIGMVFFAVFLVVAVGLVLNIIESKKTFSGAATTIIANSPDNSGVLSLLNERCAPKSGNGNCDAICGTQVCIPLEEDCTFSKNNNQCYCCEVPK